MGVNPTDIINQATVTSPNVVGQATFVEVILVTNFVGTTFINQDGFRPCPQDCDYVLDFKIQRDLFDPSTVSITRDLFYKKSRTDSSSFRVFSRNFKTDALTEITLTTPVKAKDSIVFIDRSVLISQSPFTESCSPDAGPLLRVRQRIANSREILPSRFTWP